jgi:hypothetical protein
MSDARRVYMCDEDVAREIAINLTALCDTDQCQVLADALARGVEGIAEVDRKNEACRALVAVLEAVREIGADL